jgi:hypothetical protein
MDDTTAENTQRPDLFTKRKERVPLAEWQYKTLAAWAERVGLLLFGSLVVQQLVVGYELLSPLLISLGFVSTVFTYYTAYDLLKKAHKKYERIFHHLHYSTGCYINDFPFGTAC